MMRGMGLEYHRAHGAVPMRVTAQMTEPIAYLGDLLHLDGLLHYAAYHDLDERTRKTIEPIESAEWPQDFDLPLSIWSVPASKDDDDRLLKSRNGLQRGRDAARRAGPGSDRRLWGWCASAADESAWLGRGVTEVRKKPALAEMGRYTDAKRAHLGSGPMKAYDLAIPTVLALEVTWYAHGDPDRVRRLLTSYIPAIGKKRNLGHGTVRAWAVEPCDEDRSVMHEGKPTRRLPLGAVEGPQGHGGIRPPYYHHTRQIPSVEPWG